MLRNQKPGDAETTVSALGVDVVHLHPDIFCVEAALRRLWRLFFALALAGASERPRLRPRLLAPKSAPTEPSDDRCRIAGDAACFAKQIRL